MIFLAANLAEEVDGVVNNLLAHQVDGIILASVSMSNQLTAQLCELNMPFVVFNRGQENRTLPSVTAASFEGGRTAGRFLAAVGHMRIAHIAGWAKSLNGRDRRAGFAAGLAECGMEPFHVTDSRFRREMAVDATRELFKGNEVPAAIFVVNDHTAFAVFETLRCELGLRVPADVSLVGYDDVAMSAWKIFDLTTLRQPIDRMVDETVQMLLGMIENGIEPSGRMEIEGARHPRQRAHPRELAGRFRKDSSESSTTTQPAMIPQETNERTARYGGIIFCKTAFIGAHASGSHQTENCTIIGDGASGSPGQRVHFRDTSGVRISAAGQPAECQNSLHGRNPAEAFVVLKERRRSSWGRWGGYGEAVLEDGGIFNIPTGIVRGFRNIDPGCGVVMALPGGDGRKRGVGFAGNRRGRRSPDRPGRKRQNVSLLPLMPEEEPAKCGEPAVAEAVPNAAAFRCQSAVSADRQPAKASGPDTKLRERRGFKADSIAWNPIPADCHAYDIPGIFMPFGGHRRFERSCSATALNPGGTCLLPEGLARFAGSLMASGVSMCRLRRVDDPAGKTMRPCS